MDEVLNTQGAEELEVAEPTVEETQGAEEPEVAEPENNGRTEADSAFAQMRREKEEAERHAKELEEALGLFFQGDDKQLQARAFAEQRPIEDVRREYENEQRLIELEGENNALRDQMQTQLAITAMNQDLQAIREVNPEIKSIGELGENYLKFRFAGNMNAVEAYHAMKAYEEAVKPKKPPEIGKVKPYTPAKDYYTREEVEAMSQEEVSRNYDAIRESMTKW